MAVEQRSELVPVSVKNEDAIAYKSVNRQQHKGPFQLFKVEPELPEGRKRSVEVLARGDLMSAIVHIIKQGGENELHAHRAQDATWFVLEGQVTFYDETHEPVASLNPREGLFIPRGTAYYFMSTGSETAIIMRVSGKATDVPNERLDYASPFDADKNR